MDKYEYIRAFIATSAEYMKHPIEGAVSGLQKSLGIIGTSMDLSIFDPGSSITAEFFVSLYKLINSLGSRSPLVWSALEALQNACRNSAARRALIHNYKFVPILTRLLEANLTADKHIVVLTLMQELTYGVKLLWQEAHLPYLISSLVQSVMQSKDKQLVALSLGVLVNLCYKNLPAVYTLMRTVDQRTFIHKLLEIKSTSVGFKMQSSKMMIILDNGNSEISEKIIAEFVASTFGSLVTALQDRDALLLRHTVDFFDDIRHNDHTKTILINYEKYMKDVREILNSLEGDADPECVALVMEFLLSLVNLKLPMMIELYALCVKIAMTWVPIEQVCSKALTLIRTVLIDLQKTKSHMEILADLDLSILMLVANCDETKDVPSAEMRTRLIDLTQLLHEMSRIPSLKNKVMEAFDAQAMRKLLRGIFESSDVMNDWAESLFNDPEMTFYIHALALIADLAAHDSDWLTLYSELIHRKQVLMIMAYGLYMGDSQVRQKILQLTRSAGFPQDCVSSVAQYMGELEPLVLISKSTVTSPSGNFVGARDPTAEITPLFSFNQQSRLDAFLDKFEERFKNHQTSDVTTSAVMELYEYKLAAMRHAEQATQANLKAADDRATNLQHRLSQIVAESNRLYQLLFDNQQCLEGMRAEKMSLSATLEANVTKEIPKLKEIIAEKSAAVESGYATIVSLRKQSDKNSRRIEALEQRIAESEEELSVAKAESKKLRNDNNVMKKCVQETTRVKDEIIAEKENELEQNRKAISAMKQEIMQLSQQCRNYEDSIEKKEESIQKMSIELVDLSRMRDMIYQITAKKAAESNTTT